MTEVARVRADSFFLEGECFSAAFPDAEEKEENFNDFKIAWQGRKTSKFVEDDEEKKLSKKQ